MDQPDTTPARGRRLARWGALAGGIAVVGGLTAGGAAAFAASGAPETSATRPSATAEDTSAAGTAASGEAAVTRPATAAEAAEVDDAAVATEPVVSPEPVTRPVVEAGSPMPEGYTAAQYETFWGAGYTPDDVDALADLWKTDAVTAKARAGQLLIDGATVPVAAGSSPQTGVEDADPRFTAFFDSGYTYDDAVALAAVWTTDVADAKARIGQAVLDGEPLPAPATEPAAG